MLAIALLEALEHGSQMEVQLSAGSDLRRVAGVWLATWIRR